MGRCFFESVKSVVTGMMHDGECDARVRRLCHVFGAKVNVYLMNGEEETSSKISPQLSGSFAISNSKEKLIPVTDNNDGCVS